MLMWVLFCNVGCKASCPVFLSNGQKVEIPKINEGLQPHEYWFKLAVVLLVWVFILACACLCVCVFMCACMCVC